MALDFFAGCLGGCAGVLVGHPFDTIKVRLQTQDFRNPLYKGTIDCLRTTIRNESISGLYKGISSPMAGLAFVNAIIFGVYGNVQRRMPDPNAYSSHFIAGAIAGFSQAFICSPMELVKTRMQLQQTPTLYKNPMDCLLKIMRTEGYNGVFRGLGITIAREIPGFGSYFLSYELMTQASNKDSPPLSTWHMLLAGGLAGTFSWVTTYPIDVIKSRIQADGMYGARQYSGVIDCFNKSVKAEGFRCLSRGLSSTILRAFPTNAACFTVVTWVLRLLGTEESYSTYQSIEEYNSHVIVSVQEPITLGVVVKGFEKQKKYTNEHFIWKKIFLNDIMTNCLVSSQGVKESNQNEHFKKESFILNNFTKILHGQNVHVMSSTLPQITHVDENEMDFVDDNHLQITDEILHETPILEDIIVTKTPSTFIKAMESE